MKTEFLVAASMATLFAAGGAIADHHGGKKWHGADMTRADVEARVAERFGKLDADADGEVTESEMTAAREARKERRAERRAEKFASADADGNGALDAAEWEAMTEARSAKRAERRTARFAQLDADNNGEVTQAELMERGAKRGDRWGGKDRGGDRGMRLMNRADADNSGTVTLAEMQASALARFDRMDANADGTVTSDERRAAREAWRAERQSKDRGGR